MKDLNQVQNALEAKAKNELTEVVNSFIQDLDSLQNKYNGSSFFYLEELQERDKECKTIMCDKNEFKHILINSLIEKHLEYIVKHKTKELLDKLELI